MLIGIKHDRRLRHFNYLPNAAAAVDATVYFSPAIAQRGYSFCAWSQCVPKNMN